MGEVYLARDTRLDCEFGKAILPPELVSADGRFLMLEENYKQPPTTQLQAIFNWGRRSVAACSNGE